MSTLRELPVAVAMELPLSEPATSRLPLLIKVGPVKVLAPERMRMPLVTLVRPPGPESTPETWPWSNVSPRRRRVPG